jgi:hypothetical protein
MKENENMSIKKWNQMEINKRNKIEIAELLDK